MPVFQHNIDIPRMTDEALKKWRDIPAAVASDCLGRSQAMQGAIKPVDRSMRIVAQARTVEVMVADNSALHAAIGVCRPGEVLVCDAHAYEDQAIWGGLMTRSAIGANLAGLVIDGAGRDTDEIIEMGFSVFSRAIVPSGPHKGFGGVIDAPVSCGGVVIAPGDLVIGDGDGVTVVPFDKLDATLEAAEAVLAKEAKALKSLENGGSLAGIYGVPEITMI